MESRETEVTRLLNLIAQGEDRAARSMFPIIYDELRDLARRYVARQKPGDTLDATGLVHEAFIRLTGGEAREWSDRRHFYAAAARAMRHILIDRARRKQSRKRGGDRHRVEYRETDIAFTEDELDLPHLDEAMRRLDENHPRAHEVVMFRYFAGLSIEETALALDVSPATVKRDWRYARAWLYTQVKCDGI